VSTALDRIVAATRARLDAAPQAPGLEKAARLAVAGRDRRSLRASLGAPGVRVIAECKRRSPSKGWLREPFDPGGLAAAYRQGGAAAVSVVTEKEFFAGDPGWVGEVREASGLPVLRKDFFLAPRQLAEAALGGADAVLLIAGILPGPALAMMLAAAADRGLEALVEVHDEAELERALAVSAPLVGVNARDLRTFAVDLAGAATLAARVPAERVAVVESGISSPADVRTLVARGVRRFLVGEHLLRAADPAAAVAELVACG